jgi:hypothetical protein
MRSNFALQGLAAAMAVQQAVAFVTDLPNHRVFRRDDLSRSPCPGLNVLANEGVLPKDGRNITQNMLKHAIMDIYNLDDPLAGLLSFQAFQFDANGRDTIELSDLNKHDTIEHDASLTRLDTAQGDNHSLQPDLLQALLDDADGDYLTVDSLTKSRKRRDAALQAAGGVKLDFRRGILAYGESALLLQALGGLGPQPNMAPKHAVQQWIGEERLPDGWKNPERMTIAGTTALIGKLAAKDQLGL